MAQNTWYSAPNLHRTDAIPDGKIGVGVIAPNYGLEHVSYLMDVPRYAHTVVRRVPLQRLERKRSGNFWGNTPIVVRPHVPLLHTFNMLPMNGPPFVVTLEARLPFYLGPHRDWQHKIGHAILGSDRCRKILAFSDTAAMLARRKFTALNRPDIVNKIITFRGAVLPSDTEQPRSDPKPDAPLRLIFVGANGLRKGIIPLLDAIKQVRGEGADITLTVVSSLPQRDYINPQDTTSADIVRQRLIDTDWVDYHASMPNPDVRAAMRDHDLLAFPTIDETLGWVTIEAAMEGIATLASNAFALPELVEDGVTGRIVPIPLNENCKWTGFDAPDRSAALMDTYVMLRNGLVDALRDAASDPAKVHRWGQAARTRLMAMYAPDAAALRLQQIYDEALDVSD
ncbi:glycosyltransferase family 4 protein [Octadecabacter sp. 1_MG-2023]|uniref:glycosyltransferase family 4 protein n=1 Tax=unclassified Octadecabacter TaxID=196158 RepID=UPI001C094466|nr:MULTISPECIES: glycosyltransferase family 4 protein [unclassified Octadecabacter]MBU2994068.1 glycosyltransferase family 4 protein [Octadecabacter sp. B2R22]MDO6736078.1 glycosyltransferase family 4 protein [Octadecabacter sp. 1_MG-2023]